jgi:FHS family L-fucose permease-like MFS transporter
MWSNIFTLAIAGLDKYTSQGSSLLVMMIVGGAILPLLQGALADAAGVHNSLFVPLCAYLYLIFYGLSGYRKRVRVSHD